MVETILVNKNVKSYVDDVVIHSETEQNHIKYLKNVFALLIYHGLRIRLKKCSFIQPRVEMLIRCIYKGIIHTEERKLETVHHAQLPSSRKKLSFPWNMLLLSEVHQEFCEDCKNSVRNDFRKIRDGMSTPLKQALTTPSILAYLDFIKPFKSNRRV